VRHARRLPALCNRYLAEFDSLTHNRAALGVNDAARANALAAGIVGKRLTYHGLQKADYGPAAKRLIR
jgi:hypothetical protein